MRLEGGPRNSLGISACLIDKIKSSGTQLLNFRALSLFTRSAGSNLI
jgi:hypothetical protein